MSKSPRHLVGAIAIFGEVENEVSPEAQRAGYGTKERR